MHVIQENDEEKEESSLVDLNKSKSVDTETAQKGKKKKDKEFKAQKKELKAEIKLEKDKNKETREIKNDRGVVIEVVKPENRMELIKMSKNNKVFLFEDRITR